MSDAGDSDAPIYNPDAPTGVLGNLTMPSQWSMGGDDSQPSILGPAFNPAPWTLADSTIHGLLSPADIATIDFGDDGSPEAGAAPEDQSPPSQPDDGTPGTVQPPILPDLPDISSDDPAFEMPALPDDQDGASGGTPPAQKSPLTAWPVPGHTQLNPRKPKVGQGDGSFGAFRDHGGHAHTGVDITAPVGTPVVAAGDGTVASTQPGKDYGNQIVIQHAGGFGTQYGHLSRVDIKPGAVVHAGDQIGLSGRSGNVPTKADAHVHFEVRYGSLKPHVSGGQVVDPMQYLPATP